MKLTHIMGARLTLDSGEVLTLERIGKGMFHTCYVDRASSQVYSVTIERSAGSDYSKEILSHPQLGCGGTTNPHIPTVEYLGDIDGRDNRVYRMPLYFPLRAENKTAWEQFKRLESAKHDAWTAVCHEQVITGWGTKQKMRMSDIGRLVNQRVCSMTAETLPVTLHTALIELTDAAANYGSSYCLEFSRKNCMVDGNGTLILLDVLFDLETVERMRNAAVKKARGY